MSSYFLHIAVIILLYLATAWALDIVAGMLGDMSLAQGALWGIGAYVSAILTVRFHAVPWIGILAAGLCSALVAVIVGLAASRVRGDGFVLLTIAFSVVVHGLMINLQTVTRGPLGIPGVPRLLARGDELLVTLFAALTIAVASWIVRLQIGAGLLGTVLRAVREDAEQVRLHGHNVVGLRLLVFVYAAAIAGLSGAVYAHHIQFVHPDLFTLEQSTMILTIVVIGGADKVSGPVLGSILIIGIPEALRMVGVSAPSTAQLRQMIFGGLLAIVAARRGMRR
jgi:branched-chain amino acid transport system permease protein